MNITSIIRNKVVLYLASRYITYAVQFITSLIIAAELGPYYMGIWGFILLILQYFQQFHFGIANSFNVLYVHHKDNEQECNNYIGNSLLLVSYLTLLVVCFYLYYVFVGLNSLEKYHADKYVIWICLIALMQYFVQFFINLFRVKNQLNRVTFCQSIIVFLNFVCIFFFRGDELIQWLVAGYVVGNLFCVLLAVASGSVPTLSRIHFRFSYQEEILKKGLYLFLYNSCFYFIIISIRTIISGVYSVEEFGMFSFSFTLAHAIFLLLDALSFVIFPKVISKLSSLNNEEVLSTIGLLRTVYITSAHFLIYVALICFPFLLWFFPKYDGAIMSLNLITLTILMSSNCCGYLELLISKNCESLSAQLSAFALTINIVIALFLVYVVKCSFSYVILATMTTYVIFSASAVIFGRRQIGMGVSWGEWFPLRLLIPYMVALSLTFLHASNWMILPLLLFFLLNRQQLLEIKNTSLLLLKEPDKVNL